MQISTNFTDDIHFQFATLSNDFNPIHVDREYIKKTSLEDINIHGAHILIKSLEILKKNNILVNSIKVKFIESIYPNKDIIFSIDDKDNSMKIHDLNKTYAIVTYNIGFVTEHMNLIESIDKFQDKSTDLTFQESILHKNKKFKIKISQVIAESMFPSIIQSYGLMFISEISSISNLIGMDCPGLHSIEGSLEVVWNTEINKFLVPNYSVTLSDERFNYMKMFVESYTFNARVEVIYRG